MRRLATALGVCAVLFAVVLGAMHLQSGSLADGDRSPSPASPGDFARPPETFGFWRWVDYYRFEGDVRFHFENEVHSYAMLNDGEVREERFKGCLANNSPDKRIVELTDLVTGRGDNWYRIIPYEDAQCYGGFAAWPYLFRIDWKQQPDGSREIIGRHLGKPSTQPVATPVPDPSPGDFARPPETYGFWRWVDYYHFKGDVRFHFENEVSSYAVYTTGATEEHLRGCIANKSPDKRIVELSGLVTSKTQENQYRLTPYENARCSGDLAAWPYLFHIGWKQQPDGTREIIGTQLGKPSDPPVVTPAPVPPAATPTPSQPQTPSATLHPKYGEANAKEFTYFTSLNENFPIDPANFAVFNQGIYAFEGNELYGVEQYDAELSFSIHVSNPSDWLIKAWSLEEAEDNDFVGCVTKGSLYARLRLDNFTDSVVFPGENWDFDPNDYTTVKIGRRSIEILTSAPTEHLPDDGFQLEVYSEKNCKGTPYVHPLMTVTADDIARVRVDGEAQERGWWRSKRGWEDHPPPSLPSSDPDAIAPTEVTATIRFWKTDPEFEHRSFKRTQMVRGALVLQRKWDLSKIDGYTYPNDHSRLTGIYGLHSFSVHVSNPSDWLIDAWSLESIGDDNFVGCHHSVRNFWGGGAYVTKQSNQSIADVRARPQDLPDDGFKIRFYPDVDCQGDSVDHPRLTVTADDIAQATD